MASRKLLCEPQRQNLEKTMDAYRPVTNRTHGCPGLYIALEKVFIIIIIYCGKSNVETYTSAYIAEGTSQVS